MAVRFSPDFPRGGIAQTGAQISRNIANIGQQFGPMARFRREIIDRIARGEPVSPAEMSVVFGGGFGSMAAASGLDPFQSRFPLGRRRGGGRQEATPDLGETLGPRGEARPFVGGVRRTLPPLEFEPGTTFEEPQFETMAEARRAILKPPDLVSPDLGAALGPEGPAGQMFAGTIGPEVLAAPSRGAQESQVADIETIRDRVSALNAAHIKLRSLLSFSNDPNIRAQAAKIPIYDPEQIVANVPISPKLRSKIARRIRQKINDFIQKANQVNISLETAFRFGPEEARNIIPPEFATYSFPDTTEELNEILRQEFGAPE